MAISHVKAAFCLKIAKQLTEKCELQSRGNVDSVEVIKGLYLTLNCRQFFSKKFSIQDGYLFRFKLLVKKELALIKEIPHRKSEILPMEIDFLLPKLNTALHT